MAKTAPPRSSRAQRREEARRQARRRRQQRLLLRGGLGVIVILAAAVAVWWLVARTGSSGTPVLYQFRTQDFHSLAIDPADPQTIYFGHHGGLLVSRDGGRSWQAGTLSGVDAMQLVIPLADPDRIYASGHNAFTVSRDGGQTWEVPAHNLPALDLHGFAVAPSDPDRIYAFELGTFSLYASSDGGMTWETRTLPPNVNQGMIPLAVAAEDPQHLYAGVGGQIWESLDGGQSWRQAGPGPGGMIMALAVSASGKGLYAGTDQGIWKLDNSGTWQKLPAEPRDAVLAVAVGRLEGGAERVVLVDAQGNFYRSDDGGRTWVSR